MGLCSRYTVSSEELGVNLDTLDTPKMAFPVINLKYSFHLLEVLNTIVISPKLLQIGHVLQTCKTPQICTFTTQAR